MGRLIWWLAPEMPNLSDTLLWIIVAPVFKNTALYSLYLYKSDHSSNKCCRKFQHLCQLLSHWQVYRVYCSHVIQFNKHCRTPVPDGVSGTGIQNVSPDPGMTSSERKEAWARIGGFRAGLDSVCWLSKALQALGDHDSTSQGDKQGTGHLGSIQVTG